MLILDLPEKLLDDVLYRDEAGRSPIFIQELFGEIEDEHDSVDLIEEKINDREYRFSTRLEVDYLNETYGLELTEHNYYETLGGLIVHHTESIPSTGEVIEIDNYQFTILKESATKIEEVYLKVLFKDK